MDNNSRSNPPAIPQRGKQFMTPGIPYQQMNNFSYDYPIMPSFSNSFRPYNTRYIQDFNQNSFTSTAEESSRQAFQSIESIVNAFSSVSRMLDSTYQAIYSSFQAIIAVADNFSRLKNQIVTILSAMSLFRVLRKIYRWLLQVMGLRSQDIANQAWLDASQVDSAALPSEKQTSKCNWPLFVYMSVIVGAPWLLWKLVKRLVVSHESLRWMTGETDHYVGKVLFTFNSRYNDEISCQVGQLIKIAPRDLQPMVKDWLLASSDGQTVGLVPANYLEIMGHCAGSRQAANNNSTEKSQTDNDNDGDRTANSSRCNDSSR